MNQQIKLIYPPIVWFLQGFQGCGPLQVEFLIILPLTMRKVEAFGILEETSSVNLKR
jgi:hypothetical protein